jgi:hypothetical protein
MVRSPRDLASRMASGRKSKEGFEDGFVRETFTLPRDRARERARDFLNRYPKAAYMSAVESWRELPGVLRRIRSISPSARQMKKLILFQRAGQLSACINAPCGPRASLASSTKRLFTIGWTDVATFPGFYLDARFAPTYLASR